MKTILRHIFTGKDGQTYDLGRILIAIVIMFYIGMEVMDIVLTHTFECEDWAKGAAFLLFGGGSLLFLKKDTEPGN